VLHPTFHYVRGIFKSLDGAFLFLSSLGAVIETRRTFDFDLIDAHFAYPDGFAALLLGRLVHRPVTITERGTLATFRHGSLRRRLADWALRRADRVITVAQPLADLAIAAGASADRVVVIENGVDTGRFAPRDRIEARQKLGVTPSARLLVSVGHLSKRKGFQRVISVMPRLLDDAPELRLAVVGGPGAEGNIRAQLERMVDDLGLQDRVILVGARPPDEVALWLNAADVFVLASDHEGSPNVVWEALASGRPVVASRVGDVDRMVPEFAGIVYDDPHDLNQLASSLAKALRSGWNEERIRAHGEAHGWDGVARRVLVEWAAVIDSDSSRDSGCRDSQG
jgi:glycosyltransferase involved in cell wall biosynthesis